MTLTRPTIQRIGTIGLLLLACLQTSYVFAQEADTTGIVEVDTIPRRTINPYRPSFRPSDRYGDPFSNRTTNSPLFLSDPKSFNVDVEIDTGMNYTIYEKIGNVNFRPASTMSFDEFNAQQTREIKRDYWQSRSRALDGESAVSSRNIIPKIYVSPVLDRIFGGSYVELIPRGFVTLDFGGSWQKIENPSIPIRQQRNGGFEFDQQINLSVVGKVGEKLAITTNFDNNNSFDFQNNMKVEYTGFKEDVLKKLEIGNVSLPLNNSLITGSQNLFGVKAQLQFGKLFVTSLATTQRGKQSSIEIQGGTSGAAQGRPFEIVASSYDENRHFFLGQFFRDNFEKWLGTLPNVTSRVNITKIEVYLLNRSNDTQTLRNVVGLMDMGESDKIYNNSITSLVGPNSPTDNKANDLFARLNGISANSDQINAALEGLGLDNGTDFEKITSARKLSPTEFTFNNQLGYISLQRKLQNDEAIAVAFEYTYNGQPYKVGELTEDYSNKPEEDVVYLKLLRPRKISIKDQQGKLIPTWNLMMKNIYNLNVSQLEQEGFQLRVIYRDDRTGIDNPQLQEGDISRTKQLIEVLGLDRLNPYNDPQPDGNFDFVDKLTVNRETGLIIFPYLHPFDSALRGLFAKETNPTVRDDLIKKYAYKELYNTTKAEAELIAAKNKFWIVGSFKAGSGKDIVIQGFNIAQGSVKVYAGGTPLQEGTDYTVDYTFGKVTILNEGILSSGKNITINYEQQDPFAFQTRSLLGTRFDYKLNDDINIGSTFLYYNERPLISRNLIGTEPARNLQYGVDLNLRKDSRVLTKMVDALPFLQTKEPSTINLNAEFAQLVPGTSNIVAGDGTSFIDDFENSATPYSLLNPAGWKLSTVPKTPDNRFDLSGGALNDLTAGYKRAKLAWYQIDNQFYTGGSGRFKPSNITDDDLQNHYVRAVSPREIFPNFDPFIGNFNEQIFDLAFYPSERGPYNYNPDLNPDGTLKNPTSNWGGITTAIRTEVDFDKANIEYLEFWMLNPFINTENGRINDGRGNNEPNTTGGQLVFHLGSISEDLMRDGKHAFENGLPTDGNLVGGGAIANEWGYVTTQQYLYNAFDISPESRANQDVGLDGVSSEREADTFSAFVNAVNPAARQVVLQDPSADDFQHFFGDELDRRNAKILERYKNYNGLENNSPISGSNDQYSKSGTTIPDNEDLNQDNTLSDLEEYYTYNIDLRPSTLQVGRKYIVDQITSRENPEATWYLFRIPVRQFDDKVGDINGFKSIRYARMYMTGFSQPVVLRLAKFRAVGNKWRRYEGNLEESSFGETLEPNLDNFSVSVVNVEENGSGNSEKPAYIEPLQRDRDVTSTQQRRLNEQSVQLCVTDLQDGDARAIYKNVTMDFFNYGRIKMFLSAHGPNLEDDQLHGFIRMGTDFDENYYEIEVPLKITTPGASSIESIWPEANQIDLDLNELYALKAQRDRESFPLAEAFPRAGPKQAGKHLIRILGRPDLSQVQILMIGVRNPRSPGAQAKDVCLWANELRLTDFDRTAGWAANVVLSTKLADLGTITGSVKHISFGYGGVQSKISERARGETTTFDVSANINVDKLLPQKTGLKIPMFISYENTTMNPNFDPANPDLRLDAALRSFNTESERQEYKNLIRDESIRRSLNFTNVRKVKVKQDARQHIYDIENFAFTYAFTEATRTNFNLMEDTRKNIKGAVAWQFSPKFQGFEPFKETEALSSNYLRLIKDFNFNPVPTNISVRGELDRSFSKIVYRNAIKDQGGAMPNFQKFFVFNRFYNVRWNLTKALSFDYNSRVNAIIDEPDGDIDTKEKQDSVLTNLKKLGRMKNFEQTMTANYTLPLDKLPITDWLGAEYRYNVGYSWRAGPVEREESLQLGNTIQNTQDQGLTGRIDLTKLYNKVGYLNKVNAPKRPPSATQRPQQQPDTVRQAPDLAAVRGFLRLLMSVRNISGTYNITQGTILPGFLPEPNLFGMDKSWSTPGWGFILGQQDPNLRFKAAKEGWMSKSEEQSALYSQVQTRDMGLRASIEPSTDFKIQLDAKKTSSSTFTETFVFDPTDANNELNGFVSRTPNQIGSYKVSILSINTAFKNNTSKESSVFQEFERNIDEIKDRFTSLTGQGYESKSQDVLIPAFIAAYTGKSTDHVSLSPFPNIPIPGWRVDYSGLSKLEPFKDLFQSITLNHAYSSNYSVLNYNTSLNYQGGDFDIPIEDYNSGGNFGTIRNENGDLIPIFTISQVLISETFAPLIGINVRTKKKLTMRFEYKTKRDLALNISNAQITELNSKDWSVELGYTKNNMKLPWKSQGRVLTIKNDLTFRLNMSITNNRTIQRKIEEVNTITNGNINFQLRPNVNYVVNQKLNIQFYVDRNVNEPLVTNSYRRSTTRVGFKILFNLAQ
ncbi:MAG TPA: cell surface protein SprA [Cyclobacteriaceae bacterium]|nr:cell surface protein SprA [Cyclobacteriaceae bacterium]